MPRQVAFLRAINVGGHACVKMTDVCHAFEAAGCRNVRSYIQSGNVIFDLPARDLSRCAEKIRARLARLLGDAPALMVRSIDEVVKVVERPPFDTAEPGVKLYVAFLDGRPRRTPALPIASSKEALEIVAVRGRDAFVVSRRKKTGMYGFPNGFVEAELGVAATSRNWTTVTRIAQSFGELDRQAPAGPRRALRGPRIPVAPRMSRRSHRQ